MNIHEVSIRRYRAFDQRVDVSLRNLTVLTGPNNLGKSTVLSALDLFFSVFQPRTSFRVSRALRYSYENDYPKNWEGRQGRRWPTQIRAAIELNDSDIEEISTDLADQIERNVEVIVEFKWVDRFGTFRPHITTNGTDSEEAHEALVSWLRENVRYVYIPAARNIQDLRRGVFGELISSALIRVRRSKQRLQALERLFDDVKREVADLEEELIQELRQYLPSVHGLKFEIGELDLDRLVSVGDVEIDDGAKTPLAQKGDGFKSLFTISLLQYIARQRFGSNLIFGIEEPEAHLHSSAIYEIKATLRSLAESFQVLVTTHSPILIQRDDIPSNVIVEKRNDNNPSSFTRSARNIAELRKSLGIRPHENMTTAEVVIVVEGASEEHAFPALLSLVNPDIGVSIANGRCRVLSAGGATNIPAVVRALARDATSCTIFIDSDEEGLRTAERIRTSGLMLPTDIFRVPNREGCPETEFEDLFDIGIYLNAINEEIGFGITEDDFRDAQRRSGGRGIRFRKWADVMEVIANQRGIEWDGVEGLAKTALASSVVHNAKNNQLQRPAWLVGLANRVIHYLNEE